MEREKHNVAILTVSERAILDWLQFEGGKIRSIRFSPDHLAEVEMIVEHTDLPEMTDSDMLTKITPAYRYWKRGRFIKTLRIDPQKKG